MADSYSERVERGLEGLEAVSTGICPGCQECADAWTGGDLGALESGWESGELVDEGGFSWAGCDICGSGLGGTMEAWHALLDGELLHGHRVCVDCVVYLANGDLPEGES